MNYLPEDKWLIIKKNGRLVRFEMVQERYNLQTPKSIPLSGVFLICLKYSLTAEGRSDGDPVEVLFGDRWLLAMVGLLVVAMLAILYL